MHNSMDDVVQRYARQSYPTAAELIVAQGLTFPRDPHDLLGNFWPVDESIDDFLAALCEWRGHANTDQTA
jgi:hypothetical protein